ncbi:MAG: zinc ribbon domain-containing protein [Pseudomonadota bacterium]|nr:MAG: zinc ribbon domain-containing protein [Pseudomonadota bacterium]
MAIIHCPGCSRRISNQVKACPHCGLAMGELSQEDVDRIARRYWRRQVYRASNITYFGMTLLVVGAIWWWLAEPAGWALPPPPVAVGLVSLGVAVYLAARVWLFWLRLRRNRPG